MDEGQSGGKAPGQFGTTLGNAIDQFSFEFVSESMKLVANPSFFFTVTNVSEPF